MHLKFYPIWTHYRVKRGVFWQFSRVVRPQTARAIMLEPIRKENKWRLGLIFQIGTSVYLRSWFICFVINFEFISYLKTPVSKIFLEDPDPFASLNQAEAQDQYVLGVKKAVQITFLMFSWLHWVLWMSDPFDDFLEVLRLYINLSWSYLCVTRYPSLHMVSFSELNFIFLFSHALWTHRDDSHSR
jgi:hypothetical protein